MLGQGGQGAVWLAKDTRIERTVAIKLLEGIFVSEARRARLRREAESAARLSHPGICSVYEAEVDGEVPFIAMQYVEGQDLSAELTEVRTLKSGTEKPGPWRPRSSSGVRMSALSWRSAA